MGERLRKALDKFCDFVELALAFVVVMWLLYRLGVYVVKLIDPASPLPQSTQFKIFLHDVFNFVVGIEFTKMLLKPSVDNVIEVLVFLVTRHMIIDNEGPWSILVSVLCILLLYSFHFLVHYLRRKNSYFSDAVHGDSTLIGGVADSDLDKEKV